MGAETGTDKLRLNWSARGLAYLLSKHGIERPLPITSPGDGTARVELRIIGAEVKEVRWGHAAPPAMRRVLGKDSLGHSRGWPPFTEGSSGTGASLVPSVGIAPLAPRMRGSGTSP
jgi:hypothetical protein